MGKHHDHYVPKVDRGAVHSVLEEKKLIQDTEWVVVVIRNLNFQSSYSFRNTLIKSHLKEDLKDVYTEEQIKKMSPEELDFHYFK